MKHEKVMYGGAFNPPHLDHTGHDGILGRLLETVADTVIIMPTGEREDKKYSGVTPHQREEMLRLATKDFGSRVIIDTTFLYGNQETTTRSQAEYLKNKYQREIPQVFGSDVAKNMSQWDPTGYVAHKLPKIFIARPGYDIDPEIVSEYDIVPYESRGLSSTLVRSRVNDILSGRGKCDELQGMIQRNVMEYILKNKLFQSI